MSHKERFVILARSFLESYNPRCDKEIVVLDAILAVPDALVPQEPTLRHLAHAFVRGATWLASDDTAELVGEHTGPVEQKLFNWLLVWWKEHGA